jgi:hypothetical protein
VSVRGSNALEVILVFLPVLQRGIGHGNVKIAQAAPVIFGKQDGKRGERGSAVSKLHELQTIAKVVRRKVRLSKFTTMWCWPISG